MKQEIIKGGRSWVNARTKVLRSKINRNRQLIKSSTDKTQITIWETEIEEWTWEITYITEIFTSSEVQNIIRKRHVVKRKPVVKKVIKVAPRRDIRKRVVRKRVIRKPSKQVIKKVVKVAPKRDRKQSTIRINRYKIE